MWFYFCCLVFSGLLCRLQNLKVFFRLNLLVVTVPFYLFYTFQNNGPNALHGGLKGLDKVMWRAFPNQADGSVVFSYLSRDGDEGYPGGESQVLPLLRVLFRKESRQLSIFKKLKVLNVKY